MDIADTAIATRAAGSAPSCDIEKAKATCTEGGGQTDTLPENLRVLLAAGKAPGRAALAGSCRLVSKRQKKVASSLAKQDKERYGNNGAVS